MQELIDALGEIYTDIDAAGEYGPPSTSDQPHAKCAKAIDELVLKTHSPGDTQGHGRLPVGLGEIQPAMKAQK